VTVRSGRSPAWRSPAPWGDGGAGAASVPPCAGRADRCGPNAAAGCADPHGLPQRLQLARAATALVEARGDEGLLIARKHLVLEPARLAGAAQLRRQLNGGADLGRRRWPAQEAGLKDGAALSCAAR